MRLELELARKSAGLCLRADVRRDRLAIIGIMRRHLEAAVPGLAAAVHGIDDPAGACEKLEAELPALVNAIAADIEATLEPPAGPAESDTP